MALQSKKDTPDRPPSQGRHSKRDFVHHPKNHRAPTAYDEVEKSKGLSQPFDMIEDIPLDHVEIVRLRFEKSKRETKATPADFALSGAHATKTVVRGAVGVVLMLVLGYLLVTILK